VKPHADPNDASARAYAVSAGSPWRQSKYVTSPTPVLRASHAATKNRATARVGDLGFVCVKSADHLAWQGYQWGDLLGGGLRKGQRIGAPPTRLPLSAYHDKERRARDGTEWISGDAIHLRRSNPRARTRSTQDPDSRNGDHAVSAQPRRRNRRLGQQLAVFWATDEGHGIRPSIGLSQNHRGVAAVVRHVPGMLYSRRHTPTGCPPSDITGRVTHPDVGWRLLHDRDRLNFGQCAINVVWSFASRSCNPPRISSVEAAM
jgi:hypothetical protein